MGTTKSMSYTIKNLGEVENMAPKFGFGDVQEARFAGRDLDAEETGIAYHIVKPGCQQGFGHRHDDAEEVYVVIAGSGRMKLDDEVREIERLDAIRVAPSVGRSFEAGPDGLAVLAVGAHHPDDRGELLKGFWDS